jgi:hypothetical protein
LLGEHGCVGEKLMENESKTYYIEIVVSDPEVDIHLLRWLLTVDGIEINWIEEK